MYCFDLGPPYAAWRQSKGRAGRSPAVLKGGYSRWLGVSILLQHKDTCKGATPLVRTGLVWLYWEHGHAAMGSTMACARLPERMV